MYLKWHNTKRRFHSQIIVVKQWVKVMVFNATFKVSSTIFQLHRGAHFYLWSSKNNDFCLKVSVRSMTSTYDPQKSCFLKQEVNILSQKRHKSQNYRNVHNKNIYIQSHQQYTESSIYMYTHYRIGGLMVSVLVSSAVDRGFESQSGHTKDCKIGICCFSDKHASLRRKRKDWLARNQENVSRWGNMAISGPNTMQIQLSVLVQYKADLISIKINLFSS